MKRIAYVIILVSMGCEMVVDVNVPVRPAKITVNGILDPETPIAVRLNKSRYILEDDFFVPIIDAEVIIKENGQTIEKLVQAADGYYFSPNDFKPVPGNTYDIQVNAFEMTSISANSTMPEMPIIKNTSLTFKEDVLGEMEH